MKALFISSSQVSSVGNGFLMIIWQNIISYHWSYPWRLGTLSWEWWYIQRIAAEIMLGLFEPYAVSKAFWTKSIAWKWLFFQYLIGKKEDNSNHLLCLMVLDKSVQTFKNTSNKRNSCWTIKIKQLVFYLSWYAVAQLLPKNRPAGWELSLSS